jgi:hypothetical protein
MLVRNRMTGQLHEVPDHLLYGEVVDGYGLPFLAPLLAPVAAAVLPKLVPKIAKVASQLLPGTVIPGLSQLPSEAAPLPAPPPPPVAEPAPMPPSAPHMTMEPPRPEPMPEPLPPPVPVRTPSGETVLMRPVRRRRRRMRRPVPAVNGYGYYGPSGFGWW